MFITNIFNPFVIIFETLNKYFSNYENLYFLLLSVIQLLTINILPSEWSPTGPFGTAIPLFLIVMLEIINKMISKVIKFVKKYKDDHKIIKTLINIKQKCDKIFDDQTITSLTEAMFSKKIRFNNYQVILKYKKDIKNDDILLLFKDEILPKSSIFKHSNEDYVKIDTSLVTGETSLQYMKNSIPMGSIVKSPFVTVTVDHKDESLPDKPIIRNNSIDEYVSNYMIKISIPLLIFVIIFTSIYRMYDLGNINLSYFIQTWILFNGLIPFSIKIFLLLSRKLMSFLINVTVNDTNTIDDLSLITHIISDKTGTITQNKLEFIAAFSSDEDYSFMQYSVHHENNSFDTPEDKVILEGCKSINWYSSDTVNEIFRFPFNHNSRTSSRIIEISTNNEIFQTRIYVKGSVDVIKTKVTNIEEMNKLYDELMLQYSDYRVLAFARRLIDKSNEYDRDELEKKLLFCGFVVMNDCLQKDVKTTIEYLNQYGIATSLCTGDKRSSALNIAKSIGIVKNPIDLQDTNINLPWDTTLLISSLEDVNLDKLKQLLLSVNNFVGYNMKPSDKEILSSLYDNVMTIGDGYNDIGMFNNATESVSIRGNKYVENSSKYVINEFSELKYLFDMSLSFKKRNENVVKYTFYRCSTVVSILIWYYLKYGYTSPFDSFVIMGYNNVWTICTLLYLIMNEVKEESTIHLWNFRGLITGILLVELVKNKTNLLALSSILIINLRWFKFDNFSVLLALIGPLIYTYFYSIELLPFDIAPLVGMISLII